ncbi:hypothetical protein [Acidicapsa acidisoli]|uniref:hypothetical protein n=1 Tax=Acidicapsa acidisoli TaxID=1615681 RepID=UPI0021DF69DF|nr:hypothetical protein [Acidicapsa acidisoli]
MKRLIHFAACLACFTVFLLGPTIASAGVSKKAQSDFEKNLLGKDVKALLDMPAYKDGLDLYVDHKVDKRLDERGIDLKDLSKYLKDKGVGVERDEWVTITDAKIDSDRIEIHLGGGGEGHGASKNAAKKGAGYKRAGGSRINFRYGRDLTDADVQADTFLPLLGRVLDTSKIIGVVIPKDVAPQFQEAIRSRDVVVGMSYQMVLISFGEPDQKKVDDSTDDSLHETWYYLKDGHRWVVKFVNGKVGKVQVF